MHREFKYLIKRSDNRSVDRRNETRARAGHRPTAAAAASPYFFFSLVLCRKSTRGGVLYNFFRARSSNALRDRLRRGGAGVLSPRTCGVRATDGGGIGSGVEGGQGRGSVMEGGVQTDVGFGVRGRPQERAFCSAWLRRRRRCKGRVEGLPTDVPTTRSGVVVWSSHSLHTKCTTCTCRRVCMCFAAACCLLGCVAVCLRFLVAEEGPAAKRGAFGRTIARSERELSRVSSCSSWQLLLEWDDGG